MREWRMGESEVVQVKERRDGEVKEGNRRDVVMKVYGWKDESVEMEGEREKVDDTHPLLSNLCTVFYIYILLYHYFFIHLT